MSDRVDLRVEITKFISKDPQPGIVASEFLDAEGCRHTLIDKTPLFSSEQLWTDSVYPQLGKVECKILERWNDGTGRELVRVRTLESTNGETEFVVPASELIPPNT